MDNLFNKAMNYMQPTTGGSGEGVSNDFVGRVVTVQGAKYKVMKQIAEGGFAYVFLVKDQSRNVYALKRLIIPDKDAMQSAQQEINVMKLGSQHEGFVKLIGSEVLNNRESGHSNAEVLIIMELCPGSLIHIMNDRREGFEPHDVVRIFHALTASVRFLHEQNPPIIHRDLKVENILVDKNGNVKLCDFGSATTKILSPKSAAEIAMAEEEIQLNTTPQYRAPEMWDFYEYGSVDYKSDIWSLGCALYKICYYRTPFDDGSKMVICNAELKLPPAVGSNVVFHDMMRAILKKDPKQRPNAGQILEMLTQISNKLGPKPRGPDALALPQEEMPISGSIGTDEVKDRVMGAFRSVKNKVEDAVAGSGLTNPASNKGVEIEGDFNYTYITPRIMGMRVPNFKAVKSMNAFLDGSYRNKYFVWNVSHLDYPVEAFNHCVRHVQYPKKGTLPLTDLYEVCDSINSWLLSDRDNVAVIHCQNGVARTIPLVVSYLLFTQLFTSPEVAVAHCSIKGRAKSGLKIRPSANRQAANLLKIVQGDPPKESSVHVQSISFPNLPVFTSHPAKPYVNIQCNGKIAFSTKDQIPDLSRDSIQIKCGKSFMGDISVQLMVPTREGPGAHLCLVQLYTGYLAPGHHQYDIVDLDSPVKSLGGSFYLALDVSSGEGTGAGKPLPWKGTQSHPEQALTTCFFNDSEARGQLKAYERDLVTAIGHSAAEFIPNRKEGASAKSNDADGYRTTRSTTGKSGRGAPRGRQQRSYPDRETRDRDRHPVTTPASNGTGPAPDGLGSGVGGGGNNMLLDLLGDGQAMAATPSPPPTNSVNIMGVSDDEGDDEFGTFGEMSSGLGMDNTTAGMTEGLDLLDLGGGNHGNSPRGGSPPGAQTSNTNSGGAGASAFDLLGLSDMPDPSATVRAPPSNADPFASDMIGLNPDVMGSTNEDSGMHRSHSAVFDNEHRNSIPRSHSAADFDNLLTPVTSNGSDTSQAHNTRPNKPTTKSPQIPEDPFGTLNTGMPSINQTTPSPLGTATAANNGTSPRPNATGNLGGASYGMPTRGRPNYASSPMLRSPAPSPHRSPQPTQANSQQSVFSTVTGVGGSGVTTSPNVGAGTGPGSNDPFGGLGGFGNSSTSTTAGVSKGSPMNSMKTNTPAGSAYKMSQSPMQRQGAPSTGYQQEQAQKQRQQAQKDQQAKANKQKEQNQWAKQRASAPSAGPSTGAPAVEFGGFGDLLGMHNFTPTEKDKPLQSMNDLREVEIMKNDEDGTSTTRLQVGKWTNGKTGNIRALISTLPEILWEGVEWEPIGIDKMLKPVGVKRSFMKACLVVHPDKVQDGENEYLASLIFDELNKAWTAFKEAGSPGLI